MSLARLILVAASLQACASPASPGEVLAAGVPASQSDGTIAVEVRWPRRDLPGFRAQVIPGRTRTLRIVLGDAHGTDVSARWLERDAGVTYAARWTARVPAGAGYRLAVEAFASDRRDPTEPPIAAGSAAGLVIPRGKVLRVPMILTAVDAPVIEAVEPASGPWGTALRLVGRHFGEPGGWPVEVTLGGRPLADVKRLSSTELRARIPEGASSGALVIRMDEVPSATTAGFTVTQGLGVAFVAWEDTFLDSGLAIGLSGSPGDFPDTGGLEVGWSLPPAENASPSGLAISLQNVGGDLP